MNFFLFIVPQPPTEVVTMEYGRNRELDMEMNPF